MKKAAVLALSLVLTAAFAHGGTTSLTLKAGYFSPSDQAFKNIYGGGLSYGGEFRFGLFKNFGLWIEGGYFSKTGKLTDTKEETDLSIIPIEAGIQYCRTNNGWGFLAGVGASYCLFKETNPIGEANTGGLGLEARVGAGLMVVKHFWIDLLISYSYCEMKPADIDINIGGLKAGAGLTYIF